MLFVYVVPAYYYLINTYIFLSRLLLTIIIINKIGVMSNFKNNIFKLLFHTHCSGLNSLML